MRHPPLCARPPHFASKGVALIVVMILLIAISLVSVASMRAALTAERVTHNVRLEGLAKEAAHAGLRHCEELLVEASPALEIEPAPTSGHAPRWSQWHTWHAPSPAVVTLMLNDIPQAQCMVETHAADARLFIITARGFSPDHRADSNGHITAGTHIWVQSTVSLCGDVVACHTAATPGDPASEVGAGVVTADDPPLSEASVPSEASALTKRRIQHRVWRQILNPPHP